MVGFLSENFPVQNTLSAVMMIINGCEEPMKVGHRNDEFFHKANCPTYFIDASAMSD
jgi:hypothetical protein